MSFVRAFEVYQIRWNIEVLNKECKQYLGLGTCAGRDFDEQIADCTLCFPHIYNHEHREEILRIRDHG